MGKAHRGRFKGEAQLTSIFSQLPCIQLMLNKVFVKRIKKRQSKICDDGSHPEGTNKRGILHVCVGVSRRRFGLELRSS